MIGISQSSAKRAIIDIGSNTVRLVVYNGPPRAPVVVINEKVNAKLGKDLGRTGAISEKSMRSALAALARYAALLRLMGVNDIDCVATAAARDAANGPEFLDAVRSFGLSPRLLSGEQEARASATGVIAAFPDARGIVADLGGGSLELVCVDTTNPNAPDGGILPGGITLPFGTLRLTDMRAIGPQKFGDAVRSGLKARGWDANNHGGRGLPLYIVGGSWRALALQTMRVMNWPVDDPHGFELSAADAMLISRKFSQSKPSSPDPRISNSRLSTLPDAAALMAQLVGNLRPSKLIFSSWGLREGLLHMQLPENVKQESPVLASVAAFAQSARVDASDAVRVANWTASAFVRPEQDADLRVAAGLLALATMRTEPNMRTEEALTWALRKRWIGLDMRGRGMMAMTVFANSGLTQPDAKFARLAQKPDLDRAIGWGLAVRLCRRLTGATAQGMAATSLKVSTGRLILTINNEAQPLYGPNNGKDLKLLADWLDLSWRVETSDGVLIDN